MVKLDNLFFIEYGNHKIHSKEHLKKGNTLVISSRGTDNGCYGFFNIEPKYNKIISVPSTGSIGAAFVQLHACNIDDNCLVMKPKKNLSLSYMFYIVNKIRNEKWRYLYGRQITPSRIGKMDVIKPDLFICNISYQELNEKIVLLINTYFLKLKI